MVIQNCNNCRSRVSGSNKEQPLH